MIPFFFDLKRYFHKIDEKSQKKESSIYILIVSYIKSLIHHSIGIFNLYLTYYELKLSLFFILIY